MIEHFDALIDTFGAYFISIFTRQQNEYNTSNKASTNVTETLCFKSNKVIAHNETDNGKRNSSKAPIFH